MAFSEAMLKAASALTRRAPRFRGLGRACRALNALALRLGAQPLVIVEMRDGTRLKVDLRTHTEIEAFYWGEYDPMLIDVATSLLNVDSCFLDIGGNIGFYTVAVGAFIRSKGGAGKVMAFEPYQGNFDRLLENIAINDLSDYCSAMPIGLSSASTECQITLREDFLHGSGTGNAAIPIAEAFDKGFKRAPIRLEPLDAVWKTVGQGRACIDLLKMDIEGHEDSCLQGGQQTLQTHRPTILMEVNKPYYAARGKAIDDTFQPLIPHRYRIFRHAGSRWKHIQSLDECSTVDNVFLVPEEKLGRPRYGIFSTA